MSELDWLNKPIRQEIHAAWLEARLKYTKKAMACQANAKARDGVFPSLSKNSPMLSLQVSCRFGTGQHGVIFAAFQVVCQVCVDVIQRMLGN